MEYRKYLVATAIVLFFIGLAFWQWGDDAPNENVSKTVATSSIPFDETSSALQKSDPAAPASTLGGDGKPKVYLGERFVQSKAKLRNDPNDPNHVPEETELLKNLGQSEQSALGSIHSLLESLRGSANKGYFPTGSNLDVTNALLGQNYQKVAFLPASHPRINDEGQLVDQWGTPYDFHFESSTEVSIRSGGPDQETYTDDDIILEIE